MEDLDFGETYTPVTRFKAIRILLAYAYAHNIKLYQIDVKSAFLNGNISGANQSTCANLETTNQNH